MTAPTPGLAAALAKVQAELPKLERDRTVTVQQKNGDTYSYSYVTLANLSDAILPLLAKHGLSFAAMPGAGSDGKMCVRYHLMHESGESLSGEFPVSGEGGIQMIGGRITYARRYCLAAIVGVAADEDDESRLSEDGGPRTAQRGAVQPRQRATAPHLADGEQPAARTAQRRAQPARGARPPLPGEDPDGPVGADQHRHMRALWSDLNAGDDKHRDFRLKKTAEWLDLPELDSSANLTRAQADVVIERLKERKAAKQAEPDGGDQQ